MYWNLGNNSSFVLLWSLVTAKSNVGDHGTIEMAHVAEFHGSFATDVDAIWGMVTSPFISITKQDADFLDDDGVAVMEDARTHITYRALLEEIQSAANECAARYENRSDGESSYKTDDETLPETRAVASGRAYESSGPDDDDEGSALQPRWSSSSDDIAIQDSDDDDER
jgi:hypothetical protein